MREFETFKRVGAEPHRAYYIPFSPEDTIKTKHGIIDRSSSSLFTSLDGIWQIKQHRSVEDVLIDEDLTEQILVPSCVQIHGYDQLQYINHRYPFGITFPHVKNDNPCWHYRTRFNLDKQEGKKYYLNFEGVDSFFYVYVNGVQKGYSQISHATSEFDITDLAINGENVLDVVVLKWCVSSYLEDQDKLRFSGIFRSVYLLTRPRNHVTDYKIETYLNDDATLVFYNESPIDITLQFGKISAFVQKGKKIRIEVKNVNKWTAENPYLYTLKLFAEGEIIIEKVGFRTVNIDGKVFKINGEAVKLKGVNRHDFNCKTGATVTVKDLVKDLKLMKFLNVNAIRTSHYPNMPEFYQLCDYYGFYVMDEADLEMHGTAAIYGGYEQKYWSEYAENEFFDEGIKDRHVALVERDKNRPCVIIWSLGNESSFGKAFFNGAKYVRKRDGRPVHYEGLQNADKKYYYSKYSDMVSMMYPSIEKIQKDVLSNPKEKRPFVLCEYTHAMGNSCGDISDYWKVIYNEEQCMGGFVWEWADHAIKTKKGFLYGGDFGEPEHDGNFCCDGLVTADRKLKSGALEMKAVYGGKLHSEIKDIKIPETKSSGKVVRISVDKYSGCLTSVTADGEEVLKTPMKWNVMRYTDNDRNLQYDWNNVYRLPDCKPEIFTFESSENGCKASGVLVANCVMPVLSFSVDYAIVDGGVKIEIEYKLSDHVKTLPRFGFEFGVKKQFDEFSFIGFGKGESYIDKHKYCDYGTFSSNAKENYDYNYVRPQESGSHYASKYLNVRGLFELTAQNDFSFSVNPYTTEQLVTTAHNFELRENDFVDVCVDLAMRGIGSQSCGPELDSKYEIPRKGKNVFTIKF